MKRFNRDAGAGGDADRRGRGTRSVSRRDFLNGVAVTLTSSLLPTRSVAEFARALAFEQAQYPPELTGLRGSYPGSFEAAHELRDGKRWDDPTATDERYDLVVVGGGISGLAAAYFYRERVGPGARILVLDNHDDFGGHAKRNEFRSGGGLRIGYGGTQSMENPSSYSGEAKWLLQSLGVRIERFYEAFDADLYRSLGLGRAVFFDRETFGVDKLVRLPSARRPVRDEENEAQEGQPGSSGRSEWKEFVELSPLNEAAKRDLVDLYESSRDYLPEMTPQEKADSLKTISYARFLEDVVGVDRQVTEFLRSRPRGYWGVGIDAMAAWDLRNLPGFRGMELPEEGADEENEPYIFHFPDGNASIARLLVRALIPEVASGSTMEDVVTARFQYDRLDRPESPVRIRLESTAVHIAHVQRAGAATAVGGPGSEQGVEVIYVKHGKAYRVEGRAGVLACWNRMIPYLCPELPDTQKQALAFAVKTPLVYANVLIRDWQSFVRLGVSSIHAPSGYFHDVSLDFPVSLGEYEHPKTPDEPILLHLVRVPVTPGLPPKQQFRAGRLELLETTFETFERQIRDLLDRALSAGGFDAARDIEAITVNRWPHGYAYEPAFRLFQPDWEAEDELPWVRGRQPFGRIAIANSDSEASAFTDAAIDAAHRAVEDLLA